jgi:hypothetical protein
MLLPATNLLEKLWVEFLEGLRLLDELLLQSLNGRGLVCHEKL